MFEYKIDILQALKDAGFTTYKLRKDKLLGEAMIQKLRKKELLSWDSFDTVCNLLNAQPGDLLRHKRDSD